MKANRAVGTKMAALLSVHYLPIVFSIHGERPSMTGLAYHNSDIRLPNSIEDMFIDFIHIESHGPSSQVM